MNDHDNISTAIARLRAVWQDRGRLVWLPWPTGALVLFGLAYHGFLALRG